MKFRRGLGPAFISAACCALVATSATAATTGGAAPERPTISSVCLTGQIASCKAESLARGAVAVVRGRGLSRVESVLFEGVIGKPRDDVVAKVDSQTATEVRFRVPSKARSGRIVAIANSGVRIARGPMVSIRPSSRTTFPQSDKTSYLLGGAALPSLPAQSATGAREVSVVRTSNGSTVHSVPLTAPPSQDITWGGRDFQGRPVTGEFVWRITDGQARVSDTAAFNILDHAFPIRAAHDYGTFINAFGGGRNHKGQDVLAACGAPLVAARGGTVEYAGFHSAAGYYVVIDGADTERDYVYMHMKTTPDVRTGQRVFTGERIGVVGSTGRSSACHLHFELWSGPGWFAGGQPLNPLPSLKRWDAYPDS